MTREDWLNELVTALRPWYADAGHPLPDKLRVTCGWPSQKALGSRKRRIGECWNPDCSQDHTTEISISPSLDDAVTVAAVLVHELVHAAVGTPAGHKGAFVWLAKHLGLIKPWTATAASDELVVKLRAVLPGNYPHAALDFSKLAGEKKQGTRMVKCVCDDCGYTARTTAKWLRDKGTPICPCNQKPMTGPDVDVEDPEERMDEAA